MWSNKYGPNLGMWDDKFRQKKDKSKTRTYVLLIKIGTGSTGGGYAVLAGKSVRLQQCFSKSSSV